MRALAPRRVSPGRCPHGAGLFHVGGALAEVCALAAAAAAADTTATTTTGRAGYSCHPDADTVVTNGNGYNEVNGNIASGYIVDGGAFLITM